MASRYPRISAPVKSLDSDGWTVKVVRGADDIEALRYPTRGEARAAYKDLLWAEKVLLPSGAPSRALVNFDEPPRSTGELQQQIACTAQLVQGGHLTHQQGQQTIQLIKMQLKLLDGRDQETLDDLTQLNDEELLDRIFAELTTDELLDLAHERLTMRIVTWKASREGSLTG